MIISMREILKGKLIYVVGKGSIIVLNCIENNVLPESFKIGDCVSFNDIQYQINGIECTRKGNKLDNNIGLIVKSINLE